ncbi:hypothetical protein SLEP1_g999 [Rubroshorea leprosula]|uniref:Uncharacterized protein n=1 Tax=Rubroshorea leprosula TaxID=152421 RepID=A0AAV5HCE5_9ROSI|nr:hypothetical protein SLEP1_g999 [Rubroshorea leprosula]
MKLPGHFNFQVAALSRPGKFQHIGNLITVTVTSP